MPTASDVLRLSGLIGAVTFAENAANATPQRIDADVTLADVTLADAAVAGGALAVTGLLAEDRVGLATDGDLALAGATLRCKGDAIGTVSGGKGDTFRVQSNDRAGAAAVEAVIEDLTYANVSDAPAATRTLTLDLADGAGAHAAAPGIAVTVTPENDPPTLAGIGGTLALHPAAADAAPARLFAGAILRDPDSLPSGIIVSGLAPGDRVGLTSDDVVELDDYAVRYEGALVGYLTGGEGWDLTINFLDTVTPAVVTAVVRHLTIETATDAPSSRTIEVAITDAAGGVGHAARTVICDGGATAPAGVSYGDDDGTLRAGESVTLTVAFPGAVSATGVPVLTPSDGGTATYVSGSGTASLVFAHTVAPGQNAADLAVTGVDLKGGAIRDALGHDVAAVPAGGVDPAGVLAVDTTAPGAPVILGPADGSTLPTTTPTITGSAEAGSRVLVILDGRETDAAGTGRARRHGGRDRRGRQRLGGDELHDRRPGAPADADARPRGRFRRAGRRPHRRGGPVGRGAPVGRPPRLHRRRWRGLADLRPGGARGRAARGHGHADRRVRQLPGGEPHLHPRPDRTDGADARAGADR